MSDKEQGKEAGGDTSVRFSPEDLERLLKPKRSDYELDSICVGSASKKQVKGYVDAEAEYPGLSFEDRMLELAGVSRRVYAELYLEEGK